MSFYYEAVSKKTCLNMSHLHTTPDETSRQAGAAIVDSTVTFKALLPSTAPADTRAGNPMWTCWPVLRRE